MAAEPRPLKTAPDVDFVVYFFRFPGSFSVLSSFDWPSIDWKARTVFFTGGVTNGS